jgi:hypothetical protein
MLPIPKLTRQDRLPAARLLPIWAYFDPQEGSFLEAVRQRIHGNAVPSRRRCFRDAVRRTRRTLAARVAHVSRVRLFGGAGPGLAFTCLPYRPAAPLTCGGAVTALRPPFSVPGYYGNCRHAATASHSRRRHGLGHYGLIIVCQGWVFFTVTVNKKSDHCL